MWIKTRSGCGRAGDDEEIRPKISLTESARWGGLESGGFSCWEALRISPKSRRYWNIYADSDSDGRRCLGVHLLALTSTEADLSNSSFELYCICLRFITGQTALFIFPGCSETLFARPGVQRIIQPALLMAKVRTADVCSCISDYRLTLMWLIKYVLSTHVLIQIYTRVSALFIRHI